MAPGPIQRPPPSTLWLLLYREVLKPSSGGRLKKSTKAPPSLAGKGTGGLGCHRLALQRFKLREAQHLYKGIVEIGPAR